MKKVVLPGFARSWLGQVECGERIDSILDILHKFLQFFMDREI
jgi:hypothetical protein